MSIFHLQNKPFKPKRFYSFNTPHNSVVVRKRNGDKLENQYLNSAIIDRPKEHVVAVEAMRNLILSLDI
jgi:hypothetical protein